MHRQDQHDSEAIPRGRPQWPGGSADYDFLIENGTSTSPTIQPSSLCTYREQGGRSDTEVECGENCRRQPKATPKDRELGGGRLSRPSPSAQSRAQALRTQRFGFDYKQH